MFLRHDSFRRLCRARDLLREVHERPVTIAEVAREARISPFHFIRQFEAVFGVTPHQYRIEARLDRAKQLLALGEHSVTDVCMEVGFSSLGSFSDLFTRRVGATPSAWRRRMRTLVTVPGMLPPALAPGCLSLMAWLPATACGTISPCPPVSQFSRSAPGAALSDSATIVPHKELLDANHADEPHGR